MMSRDRYQSKKGISLGGDCCVICGWKKTDYKGNSLVIGAHVRGFRGTKDYDKSDNIIGLCPNHHIEFDVGNITINVDKKICLHIDKDDAYYKKKIKGKIAHIQKGYFDYHNKHNFKGNLLEN
jgi:predicted restriction endonuclease